MVISIQAFIADIGLVANFYTFIADGSLACSYSSCGYAYVFTNLQAIVVHYGLASGYAVKVNILVQSNLVFFATVFIGAFGYSNVVTCGNSGVLLSKLFNIGYTIIKVLDIGLVLSDICFVLSDICFILSNVCFVLSDICFVLGYAFIQCCNILIGLIQLAAVDSVSRGFAYFACSYAADFAVLINGYLIVNLNIAAIQNDGGSAVGNLVAGYVDICQFCTLISIYAIFGCNSASSFDSTVGTADAYIFASQIAKHDILVHVNLVELLTVNISFFNVDVVAAYYLAVFACFGCYCMQLAAIYSIGGISGYCACCYTGNLTVFSNSYFAQLSTFSGDLAVVAACIAYKQLTVTQCGMTGIYAILQYYVADFACGCGYFAVFIYNQFAVGSIECAVAVYEERHGPIYICSAYGQIVFGIQCIGLNGVCICITIFIYREFVVCCIKCAVAVYEERRSTICFCSTYCYAACCYTAACPDSAFAAADAYKSVRIISCKSNIIFQSNLILHMTICSFFRGYSNISTISNNTVLFCFCFYIFQLAYVYSISIFSTCCYIDNLTVSVISAYGYCISSVSYAAGTQSNTAFTGNFGIMTENNSVINSCFGYFISISRAENNVILTAYLVIITDNLVAVCGNFIFNTDYSNIRCIGNSVLITVNKVILCSLIFSTSTGYFILYAGQLGVFSVISLVAAADCHYRTTCIFAGLHSFNCFLLCSSNRKLIPAIIININAFNRVGNFVAGTPD